MSCSLELRRGRAALIRLPHVVDGLHPPKYDWHIGRVVAVWEKGIRVAVVDPDTFEVVRIVEMSRCSVPEFCSLDNIDITL